MGEMDHGSSWLEWGRRWVLVSVGRLSFDSGEGHWITGCEVTDIDLGSVLSFYIVGN